MSKLSSISNSESTDVAVVTRQHVSVRRTPHFTPARSRQVLAWAAVTFILVSFVASILIDYCPRSIRFPDFESALHRYDRIPASTPAILFVGSSRFAWGVRTDEISKRLSDRYAVVSGTIPAGDPIVYQPYVHEILTTRNHPPRLVIIELSPETISHHTPFMENHIVRQFTWRDIFASLPDIVHSGAIDRLLNSRLVPVYRHSRHFRAWIATLCGFGSPPTYRDPQLPPTTPGVLDARRAERWLRHFDASGQTLESLQALLSECMVRKIPTILVGVPASAPHRACYTPEIDRAYRGTIAHLENKYFTRFVDYTAAIPDDQFADDHHLTFPGSQRFSEMLTTDVLIPQLTSSRASP